MATNISSILDYCLHDFILSELTGKRLNDHDGMVSPVKYMYIPRFWNI